MAKLLIETDALQNASNNIITYSKELTNIADSVNGYSTDADEFENMLNSKISCVKYIK